MTRCPAALHAWAEEDAIRNASAHALTNTHWRENGCICISGLTVQEAKARNFDSPALDLLARNLECDRNLLRLDLQHNRRGLVRESRRVGHEVDFDGKAHARQ